MLKTGKGSIFVSILALICIVAALGFSVYSVVSTEQTVAVQFATLLNIAALIYAAFYISAGHNKANASYFKSYGYVLAMSQIAIVAAGAAIGASYLSILLGALLLAAIVVLTVSKDLGKANSLLLCAVMIILTLLVTFSLYSTLGMQAVLSSLIKLLLVLLFTFMTFAKYQDKAARGSK